MINPKRKARSATFSYRFIFPLIDKNERIQLIINKIVATIVSSSIKVVCEKFKIFSDVKTTKQSPKRLEEALRICGDLSFFGLASFIICWLTAKLRIALVYKSIQGDVIC